MDNTEDSWSEDSGPKISVWNNNFVVYDYEMEKEVMLFRFTDDINNQSYEDYLDDWSDPCIVDYIFAQCSSGYVHLLGADGKPVQKICEGHHFANNAPNF